MTVREAVKYLSKFKDQNAPLMFECAHCGEAIKIGRVTAAVVLTAGEPCARKETNDANTE